MSEVNDQSTKTAVRAGEVALLPCPFCLKGGNPAIKHVESKLVDVYPDGYYWIGCEITLTEPNPGCGIGHSKITRDEAIATWNTRRPGVSDADRELLSDLYNLLDSIADESSDFKYHEHAFGLIDPLKLLIERAGPTMNATNQPRQVRRPQGRGTS